jgi:AcrR family transcriptional regulator
MVAAAGAARKRSSVPPRNGQGASHANDGAVRAQLADMQRGRIVNALVDVACERGAGDVTVGHVVERAGVSRRTFYELYRDRDDCFLAAFEQALAYAQERVLPAYASGKGWREQIRTGLLAFLVFLDEERLIGRLLVAESLGGGPKTVERRTRVIEQITRAIDHGRSQPRAASPVALTAEGVVGGVLAVIQARLVANRPERLVALAGPLMSMIVLPYLGSAVAQRELSRPVPVESTKRAGERLLADPFKSSGLRLTYRTVRVLSAISENPAGSNRVVGEEAGITDQGQVSKLLGRLERSGLVVNTGLGPRKGAPNSWSLTPNGVQVVHSVHAHTGSATRTGGTQG